MNLKTLTLNYLESTLDYLFPERLGIYNDQNVTVNNVKKQLKLLIRSIGIDANRIDVINSFLNHLPILKEILTTDIEAIYNGDPAAKSRSEIILAYPGFYAVAAYRIAHYLLTKDVQLIPRMITEVAHSQTGIDIHPGAQIGHSLCIDHGTGVVIGETCEIGNNVKIYQGVTLGALSIADRKIKGRRHPKIEDNVILYAQAIILGGNTVIGHDSIIGGNVWITESVEPHSKVYYNDQLRQRDLSPKYSKKWA